MAGKSITEKRCTKCNVTLPISEFYTHGDKGWHPRCKQCSREDREYGQMLYRLTHRKPSQGFCPLTHKRCSACLEVKPKTDFGLNAGKAAGLQAHCRQCRVYSCAKSPGKKKRQPPPFYAPAEKECARCHLIKPAKDFPVGISYKDGLYCYCFDCKNEKKREARKRNTTVVLKPRPDYKRCPTCQELKPWNAFSFNRTTTDGLATACKPCASFVVDQWITSLEGKRKTRERRLRNLYGLTTEQFEVLSASQQDRCPICNDGERVKPLVVDHCHSTNVVRGLLCEMCNIGIGCFRDNPEFLTSAAKYLLENSHGISPDSQILLEESELEPSADKLQPILVLPNVQ